MFAGSDAGCRRPAVLYTLIETAKLMASIPRPTSATLPPASPIIWRSASTIYSPGTSSSDLAFGSVRVRLFPCPACLSKLQA